MLVDTAVESSNAAFDVQVAELLCGKTGDGKTNQTGAIATFKGDATPAFGERIVNFNQQAVLADYDYVVVIIQSRYVE